MTRPNSVTCSTSWVVSSIGRAPHRYRRAQGFESRTNLTFFRFPCVYNYDDLLSVKFSPQSSYCRFARDVTAAMLDDKVFFSFRNLTLFSCKFFKEKVILCCHPTWPPCHVAANQDYMFFIISLNLASTGYISLVNCCY